VAGTCVKKGCLLINLEQLGDNSVTDRNFQALQAFVPDTGGQSINVRFGTVTLSWSAATVATNVTVPHGLGRLPVVVLATGKDAPATGEVPTCNPNTWTATTFGLNAETKNSWTGSVVVSWIAIG
jgi:hypothetical protein